MSVLAMSSSRIETIASQPGTLVYGCPVETTSLVGTNWASKKGRELERSSIVELSTSGSKSNKKGRCLFCGEVILARPAQIRNHHRVEGKPHVKECVPLHNMGEYPLFKAELTRRAADAEAAEDVRRADTATAAIVATNHQAAIEATNHQTNTSRAANALPEPNKKKDKK